MIETVFNYLSQPVQARLDLHQQISETFDKIDPTSIATLIDLDNCFFNNGVEHRGQTGARHVLSSKKTMAMLQDQINEGMMIFDFPFEHAKDKTRDVIRRKALLGIATTLDKDETIDGDIIKTYLDQTIKNDYARIQAVFVGDYLDILEQVENFTIMTNLDVVIGNGEDALKIVQDLKTVPDYRDLFENRPRYPGRKIQKAEPKQEADFGMPCPT